VAQPISKTVPPHNCLFDEFRRVYHMPTIWQLKGRATFCPNPANRSALTEDNAASHRLFSPMLARTGVRYKVVVISACYFGIFIPRLANPDPLVITAADAGHPSFGCRDKAKWTYFGNAFFNVALRQAKSLKDAFVVARSLVKKREVRERVEPSNPLMAGGENVQPLLIARP
jgi:hypothetical protein